MADLKGKVVVITGATTGMGEASAIEFAKYGAKLVICGRNIAGLEDTKAKCIKQGLNSNEVAIVTGDLCKEETLDLIVKTAADSFGRVDVLFLNAAKAHAISGPVTKEETLEALDFLYEILIKSPYKLTQKLSEELIKTKDPDDTTYSIMKAGQDQMTRLFALTFANKGVRVNGIRPGLVRTNILSHQEAGSPFDPDVVFESWEKLTPLGQSLTTSEEIARVVVFLACNQSACMTGTLLTLDKGFTMTHPAVDWKQF